MYNICDEKLKDIKKNNVKRIMFLYIDLNQKDNSI